MIGPWNKKFNHKFFLPTLGVLLLLSGFLYLQSASLIGDYVVSSTLERLQGEARLASRRLPKGLEGSALDEAARRLALDLDVQLTVLAMDGRVLGDSEVAPPIAVNQRNLPEIQSAISSGWGTDVRIDPRSGMERVHLAVRQGEGSSQRIVRLSAPLTSLEKSVSHARWGILITLFVLAGLAWVLAAFMGRKLGRRLGHMADFSQKIAQGQSPPDLLPVQPDDPLGILEARLGEMARATQKRIKELVGEKETVESILRCMIEGVVVLDNQGRVILLNENAKKMFNLPKGENFQGASLMEISRHPEMKNLMDRVLKGDSSREFSTLEISLDEGKWFQVNQVNLTDGDARVLGRILVFHDVSELRYLENVRADFVANVSHELRTPLTAIRGYAETMLRTPPSRTAERDQFLNIIYRHSERLGRLIDDLLTLSDLELGKVQIVHETVRAAELISSSLELFKEQATKNQISVSHAVHPDSLTVTGDADRLQELLINLIDNAIKYTPPGGEVKVAARLADITGQNPPKMVELAVSDTGCGIPQKDLPRLTERFYRVDKARSRELGGTGLGLAIVKHITQAHSGFLKIESELQKGTTIRVYLPPGEDAHSGMEAHP